MSDELNVELDEGTRIATELVAHVALGMRAAGMKQEILFQDEVYEVTVRQLPRKEPTAPPDS
jgi:hypothetical protein